MHDTYGVDLLLIMSFFPILQNAVTWNHCTHWSRREFQAAWLPVV